MARDTGDEGGNGNRSAEEAALSARLQSLGERLAQQKGPGPQAEARSGSKSDPSALARGFRLSTELVAGVLVGAFIGWAPRRAARGRSWSRGYRRTAVDLGLENRVCVVTGSTEGIGLETTRLLAEEGARVVTSGRRESGPGVGEALHVSVDLSPSSSSPTTWPPTRRPSPAFVPKPAPRRR